MTSAIKINANSSEELTVIFYIFLCRFYWFLDLSVSQTRHVSDTKLNKYRAVNAIFWCYYFKNRQNQNGKQSRLSNVFRWSNGGKLLIWGLPRIFFQRKREGRNKKSNVFWPGSHCFCFSAAIMNQIKWNRKSANYFSAFSPILSISRFSQSKFLVWNVNTHTPKQKINIEASIKQEWYNRGIRFLDSSIFF